LCISYNGKISIKIKRPGSRLWSGAVPKSNTFCETSHTWKKYFYTKLSTTFWVTSIICITMVKVQFKHSSICIMIWIHIKVWSAVARHTSHPHLKIWSKSSTISRVILSIENQTNGNKDKNTSLTDVIKPHPQLAG